MTMPLTILTIKDMENKVREFHVDKKLPRSVSLSEPEYLLFRNGLLLEEISELFMAIYRGEEAEVADGLIDILYVVVGTCVLLDMPIGPLFEEVHRSNMTKRPGAIKGEKYEKPRLKDVLEKDKYCKTMWS